MNTYKTVCAWLRAAVESAGMRSAFSSARAQVSRSAVRLLFGITAILAFGVRTAASEEEFETHGAHEHGIATLNIALEANRLELELESPLVNVIGFEHAPRTDRERATVERAERTLRDASGLFAMTPAAECHLRTANIQSPTWEEQSGHADYEAHYVFECAKPQLLRSIDVRLVGKLMADSKVRVQVTGRHAQTATELTTKRSIVQIP